MKLGTYENERELSDKIEWEGGVSPFFLEYSGVEEWRGTPLEKQVDAFNEAYDNLVDKLMELGVVSG